MSIRSSKSEIQKLLKKVGYTGTASAKVKAEWMQDYRKKFGTTSVHIARDSWASGSTEKKSITDSKWKCPYRDDEEKESREALAVKEAENRARSIAPAYNKGAYQPICPSELKTMGRKI